VSREFDLIARYFTWPVPEGMLGVGDDCALVPVTPGYQLATSTDLLIEGRHFFSHVDPAALGHKSLAVNISDLAAMGAEPLACLLSLSLPEINESWLAQFAAGFRRLAQQTGCALVGGDTTQGSAIVINVTVLGQVKPEQALRRSAARLHDDIWVTGHLGAPDIALELLQRPDTLPPAERALLRSIRDTLEKPQPPWQFGAALAGIAHAAIDISDGLLQDLGHILAASRCGATLYYSNLPGHPALHSLNAARLEQALLCGGDVYQLCFTASPDQAAAIGRLGARLNVPLARIGTIQREPGIRLLNGEHAGARSMPLPEHRGFSHFD
jgi:thiamine-monophosphate kinase